MRTTQKALSANRDEPEPTWEIAHLFPAQGTWSESDYLALDTNRHVELVNGRLEVLPFPTTSHQWILAALFRLFDAFVNKHDLGTVLFSGTRVKVARSKIREPDLVFIRHENAEKIAEDYWRGADLVLEIVSPDDKDRQRDLVTKRAEYAKAHIAEYWIVDPASGTITVLFLSGGEYREHGVFARGSKATSRLLAGLSVDVDTVLRPRPANGKRKRKSSS